MTADQAAPAATWRVKVLQADAPPRMSLLMTEAEAVALADRIATQAAQHGAGPAMLPFPSRHGVTAWLQASSVRSAEPVGPRWDGEEHPARELPDPDPGHLTNETAWLERRGEQQAGRIQGLARVRAAGDRP